MSVTRVFRHARACQVAFVFSLMSSAALAAVPCEPLAGRLVSVQGEVEVQSTDEQSWRRAELNGPLCREDTIRVGARSRAAVALENDVVLRIDQNTTIRLLGVEDDEQESSLIDMIFGALQSFSRKPRKLAVNTPYLNATIEGTEFALRVDAAETQLAVFEGQVAAANEFGRILVASGAAAAAQAGRAPEPRTLVRPRDAVQWALYYPPVLAGAEVAGGFAALDGVPESGRDARFHLSRAALNLAVGRVPEARADIDRALAQDPNAGLAYAQRAVIAVVQNERQQALADGARGVELSPDSAAARIALSYAQQANFRLEDARDTLLQAVEAQPEDALAWARLAELWLALGYRGRANDAAERAAALAPDLARVQLVRGFAALTEFRTLTARDAFGRAIELESADPLPHLGLGLAKIREGSLEAGRKDLEIAVGLDSGNALLRAYLGKAYFEEKRAPLDAEQLVIAKELDPLDPTPYLYDAIRKQSENRPGEALQDVQASIERNDNRAVYRGRQQLDQDRAARGTSLARVYDDLGFVQPGVNEASKSLALAPDNASAHRFLSDSLRAERRREIARVSELLQAQMLQDINVNPVQPSISETNLNIITSGGPSEAGFNEFTPLFERNQIQLNATGEFGNHDTWGGEGVATALYDRFSVSAGGFHHESDGWRDNNGLEQDIYNVFAQAAITPELNVQAEYRRRETDSGDLTQNFDPDDFLANFDSSLEQDMVRGGLRYSPTPNSDILLSVTYSDSTEEQSQVDTIIFPFPPPIGPVPLDIFADATIDLEGTQTEGQYIYRRDFFNLTTGFAYADADRDLEFQSGFVGGPPTIRTVDNEIEHWRGYAYGNVNFPDPVTWTLGVSYDDYEEKNLDIDQFNPKFGVRYEVTPDITLRGAVTRTVKPALVNNRTLEPTQVAGFNQFFDDIDATESWRYGGGLEWNPLDGLFVGGEVTWRDYDEPLFDLPTDEFVVEDREEQRHRAYVNWTPLAELALSAEFVYDRFEGDSDLSAELPDEVKTVSVPLGARYFHSSGFFFGLAGTYVDQEVERQAGASGAEGSDDFFLVDAAIGWRIPRRLGIASLEVRNLFDKEFNYLDDSFREFGDDPAIGPYIPDRTILGRVTISF